MHSQVDLTEDVKNVLPVANGGAGDGVNHQTGTSYSVTSGDNRMLVALDNASAVAVTLPDPAALPAGFACHIANIGAGLATLTPAAGTVDGAASLSLAQDQGAMLFSDGSNYFSERGMGATSGGAGGGGGLTGFVTPSSLSPPSVPSFTELTDGSSVSTSVNSGGAVWMDAPADGKTYNLYQQMTPPWKAIVGMVLPPPTNNKYTRACFFLRDGTGGKVIYWRLGFISFTQTITSLDLMDDYLTYGGTQYFSHYPWFQYLPIQWLKIVSDATNLTWYWSADGQNWIQVYQTTVTAWCANSPNQAGIGVTQTATSGNPWGALFVHWEFSAP